MSHDPEKFQEALLFLIYLIISADGVIDETEVQAVKAICKVEKIPEDFYQKFQTKTENMKEKDIYHAALENINNCNDEDKLRAFAWLYKISEVDGHVHVKEVRFLLYSLKKAGLEFAAVVEAAEKYPPIL